MKDNSNRNGMLIIIAMCLMMIGLSWYAIASVNNKPKVHHDIIVFDKEVDSTSDLNSTDVFRITARHGDTLVMGYYY